MPTNYLRSTELLGHEYDHFELYDEDILSLEEYLHELAEEAWVLGNDGGQDELLRSES